MTMKTYSVNIEQRLARGYKVKANSQNDAIDKAFLRFVEEYATKMSEYGFKVERMD